MATRLRAGTRLERADHPALAYEYLDAGDAAVDITRGPLSGTVQGDYSSNQIHTLLFGLRRKF